MKKTLTAAALAATLLLTACGADGRMSIQNSCKYLSSDTFKPAGTQLEQAKQLADHYADVAQKVDPSIGVLVQKMADLQKKVADSAGGVVGPDQKKQLSDAYNSVGKICGG
jgi:outer membrane lipopolysaccharide assembly protein LptE/RlpB